MLKRGCFGPINFKSMSKREKERTVNAIMYLTEKSSGEKKGRMVYNGAPTRGWINKEDTTSPTAAQEGTVLSATIDAKERRDVMTCDIPNAYIQAMRPPVKKGEDRVIMKITGSMVDLLLEIDPIGYDGFVVIEKGKRVVYVEVQRAYMGILKVHCYGIKSSEAIWSLLGSNSTRMIHVSQIVL